ncbi:MAG TPA: hypothetical protein VHC20_03445 [Candidatus Paceibacterota bacterium]|nr:hypothetical protein [Candidatus Paceibacterota bacterium]
MKKRIVKSSDPLQRGYCYTLTAPAGKRFDPEFKPQLTPQQMLELGMFGGVYFYGKGAVDEYPKAWFKNIPIIEKRDKSLNYFNVNASQPMSAWVKKGWIYADDPRGWVQWYFRYYMGRRIPKEDARQIHRWKMMVRHIAQIKRKCVPGDVSCNPRQRQALLHWAYDSRKF